MQGAPCGDDGLLVGLVHGGPHLGQQLVAGDARRHLVVCTPPASEMQHASASAGSCSRTACTCACMGKARTELIGTQQAQSEPLPRGGKCQTLALPLSLPFCMRVHHQASCYGHLAPKTRPHLASNSTAQACGHDRAGRSRARCAIQDNRQLHRSTPGPENQGGPGLTQLLLDSPAQAAGNGAALSQAPVKLVGDVQGLAPHHHAAPGKTVCGRHLACPVWIRGFQGWRWVCVCVCVCVWVWHHCEAAWCSLIGRHDHGAGHLRARVRPGCRAG